MPGAVVIEKAAAEDLALGVGTVTRTNPAGGAMTASKVNLASFALTTSQTWDPGQVGGAFASPVTVDVTVAGAQLGDVAAATHTGDFQNDALFMTARVVAANTVRVCIHNHSGVVFNPGTGTLRVLVFRIP